MQPERPNLLDRIRDWFDAPRYCRDDGSPITVENIGSFDERTGAPRDRWVWRCPKVWVTWGGGRMVWSQSGDTIHDHGTGRPRWHRLGLGDDHAA